MGGEVNVTIQDAYAEACRQLGEASVQAAFVARALAEAEAERDEAGQRIVELLGDSEAEHEHR